MKLVCGMRGATTHWKPTLAARLLQHRHRRRVDRRTAIEVEKDAAQLLPELREGGDVAAHFIYYRVGGAKEDHAVEMDHQHRRPVRVEDSAFGGGAVDFGVLQMGSRRLWMSIR